MKSLPLPIRLMAIGTLLVVWSSARAATGDFATTLLSQSPVGYWRLNETIQPPPAAPAANIGSLATAGNGQYLFGPKRGEPGALSGSQATSVRFFNPTFNPGFGGS